MQAQNNQALRALFTVPPMKESAGTALAVPEMPKEGAATGDREVDAVLWLQSVVATGHQAYINKALEAVKRIKTPMKALEDRYVAHLKASGAHMVQILFGTMGFGDLESKAKSAIEKARVTHEALSRFGSVEALFADTRAEKACKKALRGLKRDDFGFYIDADANARFSAQIALVPFSIDDCLHARTYHRDLYRLRNAFNYGDGLPQAYAHECYCRAMLARIAPRDQAEAIAAFEHLYTTGADDSDDAQDILRNLIASGWNACTQTTKIDEVLA